MPNYTGVTPRPFRGSYSQLHTFAECGKAYELSSILRVPRRPGVWFPAGTAVHETIQDYLLASLGSP